MLHRDTSNRLAMREYKARPRTCVHAGKVEAVLAGLYLDGGCDYPAIVYNLPVDYCF